MTRQKKGHKPDAVEPAILPPPMRRALAWTSISLLAMLLFTLSWRTETSLDLGFHLRSGAYVLEHGWPEKDAFTYTLNDRPYIDSQWLFQVVAVGVERAAGIVALTVLKTVLLLAAFALVALRVREERGGVAAAFIAGLLAILSAEMRFMVRPEVFSFVLLAGLLFVLRRGGPYWTLPLIQWVWVNSHGLFVLGGVAIAARLFEELIHRRSGARPLMKWSGLSLAACLVNPYGIRGLLFPLDLWMRMTGDDTFGQAIGEFASPFGLGGVERQFLPVWPVSSFFLLSTLAGIGLLARRRDVRLFDWIIVPLFFVLAATAIRNLPLFAIAATLAAVRGVEFLGARIARALRRIVGRVFWVAVAVGGTAAVLLVLYVFHDGYYISMRRPERFGASLSAHVYPADAVTAIRALPPGGNLYNHLNFGGYLMWQLPERPVFIDGRTEVVGSEFFKYYLTIKADASAFRQATRRWDFRVAVLPPSIDRQMLKRLYEDPDWRLAYLDGVAAVFVRDGQPEKLEPPPSLEPLRTQAFSGKKDRPFGDGLVRRQRFPSQQLGLGVAWSFLDQLDHAEASLLRAVNDGPTYWEVWYNLGLIYGRKKDLGRALFCFRRVLDLNPDHARSQQRVAQLE